MAKKLRPVHAIWPCIAATVKPGEKISPCYSAQNANARINAVLTQMEIPCSRSYSSHGFRRIVAQELKNKGSQWPAVMGVGCWRSLSFLGYVDIARDVERDMSKLLVGTEDLSEDEVRWVTGPRKMSCPSLGDGAPFEIPSFVDCFRI